MKKVLAYAALFVLIAIYVISASDKMTRYIAQKRFFSNSIFSSDKYRFGDLYGRTFLPGFKDLQVNQPLEVKPKLYGLSGKKDIDLYAVHDSYLMRDNIQGKMDTMVQGLHKYIDIKWWKNLEGGVPSESFVCLDSTKENILVIEIAERDLVRALSTPDVIYDRLKDKSKIIDPSKTEDNIIPWYYKPYALPSPFLEDNLQFNIFDYHIFTPLKELKAFLTYKLFGHTIDNAVVVSSGEHYLFYSKTVNEPDGSFSAVSSNETNQLVETLNSIYVHYKNLGFNEVFFSPIPNPVVILDDEPKKYNGLIPGIQNNGMLKIPLINAYEILKNATYKVYSKGESHWTRNGFQLWLNELNRKISIASDRNNRKVN
jgi:hypothetical protein